MTHSKSGRLHTEVIKSEGYLGAVPLDSRIGMACDYGESFFDNFGDSPACEALKDVVRRVGEEIGVPASEVLGED